MEANPDDFRPPLEAASSATREEGGELSGNSRRPFAVFFGGFHRLGRRRSFGRGGDCLNRRQVRLYHHRHLGFDNNKFDK